MKSYEQMQDERRYQAGRPYYRPHLKHQVNEDQDHWAVLAFLVGCCLGATVCLALISTGVLIV